MKYSKLENKANEKSSSAIGYLIVFAKIVHSLRVSEYLIKEYGMMQFNRYK
jgi:hypothetical protein